MRQIVFPLLFSLLLLVSATDKYPDQTKTYVHLIPHTHDDMGWLKSIEEYYYGVPIRGDHNEIGIQYIIQSILGELTIDPEKRFSWVEVGYFYRYWIKQESSMRDVAHKLIKDGKLEFLHGGWSMHDEAVTYYEDIIDNMALGQKFLNDNFGIIPKIGWQIDPFGHSSANAALFSKMGLDAFWFSRIDHNEKEERKAAQNLEFIWQPRTSQGDENQILAVVTADHYDFPKEFCFDLNCWTPAPPVIDDPHSEGFNVELIAERFVNYIETEMRPYFKHNHVVIMMGGDFAYGVASMPFSNYAKIKKYINSRPEYNMEIMYSSAADYLEAINSKELNYTINQADFFPYADKPRTYWTGYYTSRSALKHLVRKAGKDLQNVRRLFTYSLWKGENFAKSELNSIWEALDLMERTQAELQHHDGVTGTSKKAVAEDYAYILSTARENLHQTATNIMLQKDLQKLTNTALDVKFAICETDNVDYPNCDMSVLTENQSIIVAIFNPTEAKSKIVTLPIPLETIKVTSLSGRNIKAEVICIGFKEVGCTLFFEDEFAGQSTQYYIIAPDSESLRVPSAKMFQNKESVETIEIADGQYLEIQNSLTGFKSIINDVVTEWSLHYKNYTPRTIPMRNKTSVSGVYIFSPEEKCHNETQHYATPTGLDAFIGDLAVQIAINWEDKLLTKITIFNDLSNVQIETLFTKDFRNRKQGEEIVMIIDTDIQNNKTFYTDSNGMEMQKRVLNLRENWDWNVDEPISGNYYPITSSIYIEDPATQKRATLLVDRAVGGSSLEEGQLEIMLERQNLLDDDRGMGERLQDDFELIWHSTTLLITVPDSSTGHNYRAVQYALDQPNLVLVAPLPVLVASQTDGVADTAVWNLPKNVKVLPWPIKENKFVVRFHNMDDQESVSIDLNAYLNIQPNNIKLTEMTVTGVQELKTMLQNKLDWTYKRGSWLSQLNTDYINNAVINLRGQEIRTFLFEFPEAVPASASFLEVGLTMNKKNKRGNKQTCLRG